MPGKLMDGSEASKLYFFEDMPSLQLEDISSDEDILMSGEKLPTLCCGTDESQNLKKGMKTKCQNQLKNWQRQKLRKGFCDGAQTSQLSNENQCLESKNNMDENGATDDRLCTPDRDVDTWSTGSSLDDLEDLVNRELLETDYDIDLRLILDRKAERKFTTDQRKSTSSNDASNSMQKLQASNKVRHERIANSYVQRYHARPDAHSTNVNSQIHTCSCSLHNCFQRNSRSRSEEDKPRMRKEKLCRSRRSSKSPASKSLRRFNSHLLTSPNNKSKSREQTKISSSRQYTNTSGSRFIRGNPHTRSKQTGIQRWNDKKQRSLQSMNGNRRNQYESSQDQQVLRNRTKRPSSRTLTELHGKRCLPLHLSERYRRNGTKSIPNNAESMTFSDKTHSSSKLRNTYHTEVCASDFSEVKDIDQQRKDCEEEIETSNHNFTLPYIVYNGMKYDVVDINATTEEAPEPVIKIFYNNIALTMRKSRTSEVTENSNNLQIPTLKCLDLINNRNLHVATKQLRRDNENTLSIQKPCSCNGNMSNAEEQSIKSSHNNITFKQKRISIQNAIPTQESHCTSNNLDFPLQTTKCDDQLQGGYNSMTSKEAAASQSVTKENGLSNSIIMSKTNATKENSCVMTDKNKIMKSTHLPTSHQQTPASVMCTSSDSAGISMNNRVEEIGDTTLIRHSESETLNSEPESFFEDEESLPDLMSVIPVQKASLKPKSNITDETENNVYSKFRDDSNETRTIISRTINTITVDMDSENATTEPKHDSETAATVNGIWKVAMNSIKNSEQKSQMTKRLATLNNKEVDTVLALASFGANLPQDSVTQDSQVKDLSMQCNVSQNVPVQHDSSHNTPSKEANSLDSLTREAALFQKTPCQDMQTKVALTKEALHQNDLAQEALDKDSQTLDASHQVSPIYNALPGYSMNGDTPDYIAPSENSYILPPTAAQLCRNDSRESLEDEWDRQSVQSLLLFDLDDDRDYIANSSNTDQSHIPHDQDTEETIKHCSRTSRQSSIVPDSVNTTKRQLRGSKSRSGTKRSTEIQTKITLTKRKKRNPNKNNVSNNETDGEGNRMKQLKHNQSCLTQSSSKNTERTQNGYLKANSGRNKINSIHLNSSKITNKSVSKPNLKECLPFINLSQISGFCENCQLKLKQDNLVSFNLTTGIATMKCQKCHSCSNIKSKYNRNFLKLVKEGKRGSRNPQYEPDWLVMLSRIELSDNFSQSVSSPTVVLEALPEPNGNTKVFEDKFNYEFVPFDVNYIDDELPDVEIVGEIQLSAFKSMELNANIKSEPGLSDIEIDSDDELPDLTAIFEHSILTDETNVGLLGEKKSKGKKKNKIAMNHDKGNDKQITPQRPERKRRHSDCKSAHVEKIEVKCSENNKNTNNYRNPDGNKGHKIESTRENCNMSVPSLRGQKNKNKEEKDMPPPSLKFQRYRRIFFLPSSASDSETSDDETATCDKSKLIRRIFHHKGLAEPCIASENSTTGDKQQKYEGKMARARMGKIQHGRKRES